MLSPGQVIVPLVSPFTDDTSSLSEIRFARVVRFHRERGAASFLVCSEAGEPYALSLSERKQLVEWAIRDGQGASVYVNVTANTTAAVIDLLQHAERHGAKAGVYTNPTTIPLTPLETTALVAAVRRYGNLPSAHVGPLPPDIDVGASIQLVSLNEAGFGEFALSQTATPEEFVHESHVATPLGVLGADRAAKVASSWERIQVKVKTLFGHGRSCRVGKAYLESMGIETGHTRGPVKDLDDRGRQVLASVLDDLAQTT